MPYSTPVAYRVENRLLIVIDLPDSGELSERGRAENLVDPTRWLHWEGEHDHLGIKLTVCRPLRKRRPR